MSTKRQGVGALILCVLLTGSFYLRCESLWRTVVVPPEIRADAKDYFAYAFNVRHHGIYSRDVRGLAGEAVNLPPDAVRSPGYPLYLTLFLGSESIGAFLVNVLFSQVVISTFTVVLAFLMYRRFLSLFWSSLAAFFTALSPHLIVANSYLLTETLFCFLLVAACWWGGLTASKTSWKTIAVLGSLLAVANLVRPSLLFFPFLLALVPGAVLPRGQNRHFRGAAALLAGFALITIPWFGRNLVSLRQFSDNTLQIAFLHHGIYPDFMYNHKAESYGFPYRFDPRTPEISRSTGTVLEEIVRRFASEPGEQAMWYLFKKPVFFWSWDLVQGQGDAFVYPVSRTPYANDPLFVWSHRLMRLIHYPLIWAGLLGCILAWLPGASRKTEPEARAAARFISLLLLYFTVLHMAGAPFPRYSVPLRPLIYGMAMFAAAFVWDSARNRSRYSRSLIDEKAGT